MVEKYAEAFGKGELTIHKLRHTFATQHYKTNKDIATLKRQLIGDFLSAGRGTLKSPFFIGIAQKKVL
jgi:integrase